jgi:hypothetical protein
VTDLRIAQVVYNADTKQIEFRIPLTDGTGDHVLAALPATPPVPVESFLSDDPEETVYGTPEGF